MKNTKRRVRRRKSRRRGWRRQRDAATDAARFVDAYARERGLDRGGQEARALERAVSYAPPRFGSSGWLEPAIDAVTDPDGVDALRLIDALDRFLRWVHERGRATAPDIGCQLLNLEILRRKRGCEARTIPLPKPRPDEKLPEEALRHILAEWETFSYAGFVSAGGLDEAALAGTGAVVLHLAEVDGLPVRLDRLRPVDLAATLIEWEADDRRGPAPERFVADSLSVSADFYAAAGELGLVDPAVAERIEDDLTILAMGYASHAA